jgi:hypothetical protein
MIQILENSEFGFALLPAREIRESSRKTEEKLNATADAFVFVSRHH